MDSNILCERCQEGQRQKGNRFCKQCCKKVLQELKDAGYLKPAPQHGTPWRTSEHQENIRETKFGRDG